MKKSLQKEIKQNLESSLRKHIQDFKYDTFHPLDFLIPKERKIRSIVGGLETSMGTKVWEPIATTLARSNGFEVIEEKILKPDPFPKALEQELGRLISRREDGRTWISTKECIKRLRKVCKKIDRPNIKEYIDPPPGNGVDVFFRKKGVEYAFDTKTVQPNVGSIKSYNKQILEWYAYRICANPNVKIECRIAYPYNPYSDDFWKHQAGSRGILEPGVDAVVENEFWDFLSGENDTFKIVTKIFDELVKDGLGKELSGLIEKIHIQKKN